MGLTAMGDHWVQFNLGAAGQGSGVQLAATHAPPNGQRDGVTSGPPQGS